MQDLQHKAIDAALKCDWERVIDYNHAILQDSPLDIKALNRLAKGYMELGQKNQAEEAYDKVLQLDKYNTVAQKNLKLLPRKNSTASSIAEEDFIEQPGETKTSPLIKLASREIIAELYAKQPLSLRPQGKLVAVYTQDNSVRIGSLPDDLSFKIKKLIEKGYKYAACIKAVEEGNIHVFVREIKRPKRYEEMHSFSATTLHKKLKK